MCEIPQGAVVAELRTSTVSERCPPLLPSLQMLFTGGFDVLCYELGPGKVMVTMQRGWNAIGVKDFLLEQPEVCV